MKRICGIDEAGRGPLAGPVVAAAVILPVVFPTELLKDSKALSEKNREHVLRVILRRDVAFGVGWAWPEEIDRINILQATMVAMRRAYDELAITPDLVIVDGNRLPELPVEAEARVKADSSVFEVMAASIIAKVVRDRWMIRYSWFEPNYGYERHKGYATSAHRNACRLHGPSPIQRHSFRV